MVETNIAEPTDPYEVVAVNRDGGLVLFANGGSFPITKYLDDHGEECDEPDAVMAIAGFDYTWLWVDLREFTETRQ